MFFHPTKSKFIFTLINIFLLIYSLQASEKIEENVYYKIKNPETEKVLSIHDAHRRGNKVIAEIDNGNYPSHKLFKLTLQGNNLYYIKNLESQKVLSVYQAHTGDNEIIAEVDDGNYLSQKLFEFISQENNLYSIKNLESHKVISIFDTHVKGNQVIVEDEDYNPDQYKTYKFFKLEKDIEINNFLKKISQSSSFPEQSYSFNNLEARDARQANIWRDPKTGQQILLEQNIGRTLFLQPQQFSDSKQKSQDLIVDIASIIYKFKEAAQHLKKQTDEENIMFEKLFHQANECLLKNYHEKPKEISQQLSELHYEYAQTFIDEETKQAYINQAEEYRFLETNKSYLKNKSHYDIDGKMEK